MGKYGNVYFDQLVIRFSRGKLKEEAHYYSHGLPIAGMGSTANGMIENRDKYQANGYIKDLGLNWVDFNNRQYDPQIGRFLSVDPLAPETDAFSPYAAMNNNPASLTDPEGLAVGQNRTYAWSQREPVRSTWEKEMDGIMSYLNGKRLGMGGMDWDGGSGFAITLYGDNARSVFAAMTGQSSKTATGGLREGDDLLPEDAILVSSTLTSRTYSSETQGYITIGDELKFERFAPEHVNDFDGFWGKVKWLLGGSTVGRGRYDWNGDYTGLAPIGGIAPTDMGLSGVKLTKLINIVNAIKSAKIGLRPLGLETTGRTVAANLVERMAMEDALANPHLGVRIMEGMNDTRWLGWTKMEYKVRTENGINAIVHYVARWENGVLKAVDDFKFK